MPKRGKKRHCWNCQGSHLPPTGHKCTQITAETIDDFWEKNLNPADIATELWSNEWTALKKEEASCGDHEVLDMNEPSPGYYSTWSKRSDYKPSIDTRPHCLDSYGDDDRRRREEEVAILREDVARLRDKSKYSRDKLADIEHLLRSSLPAVNVLARDRKIDEVNHPVPPVQGPVDDAVNQPTDEKRRGRSRQRGKTTLAPPKHIDSSPTATSPYGSSASSSSSDDSPEWDHRLRRDKREEKPKNSHRRYKLSKYLPKEERSKPMNTEKLWFCHGALMLDHYVKGYDISGMIRHNVFIAEKAASRAYLSSGIVKYDEVIRDIARRNGSVYSGGNMEVAMRFLSVEYARPKPQGASGYGGTSKQNQVRKGSSGPNKDIKRQCCWAFNSSGCNYENCKYPHQCSK